MNDQITQAVLARQPEYPPEQSMGGINTHTVACRVVGYSPGYCVCLHKIAAYERGGEIKSAPTCASAIRSNDCPALKMRSEERAAGKALYFIDRGLLREEMDKFFAETNAQFKASRPAPAKPTATAAKKPVQQTQPARQPLVELSENGFAAAINAAIKEEAKQAQTQPAEQKTEASVRQKPEPKGMTLLEKALFHLNKTPQGVSHD